MSNRFNEQVVLGLRNHNPFNKHVKLILTHIVKYLRVTQHERDMQTRIATPTPTQSMQMNCEHF